MPHVEIKYSDNLNLDVDEIFDVIEKTINDKDSNAGVCKSRAYPCSKYKYTHVLLTVSLLTKPHRDELFTKSLSEEIQKAIKSHFKQSLYFSLDIEYSSAYYSTNVHLVEGDHLKESQTNNIK